MAYVQINEDKQPPANSRTTGRLRWFQPIDGGPVLQQEWTNEHGNMSLWIRVPMHVELQE